jgi:hypothetical protein
MTRSTASRVTRLEKATPNRQRTLLVAGSQAEADALRARHPGALVVVTGVVRVSHSA